MQFIDCPFPDRKHRQIEFIFNLYSSDLRELAHVHPFRKAGKPLELRYGKFDRAVGAAAGGKNGLEAS